MNKYEELIKLLVANTSDKGSFSLYFNEHKSIYNTPEQEYGEELFDNPNIDITKDIYWLSWYKDTPVGSYGIIENDVINILKRVKEIIKEEMVK